VPRALIAETIDLVAVLAGRGSQRRLVELARVEGLGAQGDYRVVPAVNDGGDIQPVLDFEPTGDIR
jgi:type IV secretion system protein TrbB